MSGEARTEDHREARAFPTFQPPPRTRRPHMLLVVQTRIRSPLIPVLGAVFLSALVLRSWGLTWGLQHADVSSRAHPDEWVVYWLFQWFHHAAGLNPCPDAEHDRCFFDWGTVYLYLAYGMHAALSPFTDRMPAYTAGSHTDAAYVYSVLAGRIVSVLASGITIFLTYQIGRQSDGPGAGTLAALMLTISTLSIQLSHFATPDSTALMFSTGSLLAMVTTLHGPDARRFALAGVLAGLAIGTEYHMVLLGVPLVCVWLLTPGRKASMLAAGFASCAAAFLITNPYAVAEAGPFAAAIRHAVTSRTVNSQQQYQDEFTRFGSIWLYTVRYSLGYGIGFALTGCAMGGVVWGAIRRHRSDLILLAWVAPYFLLITLSPAKYMRYAAPLLPSLAVLTAGLAIHLLRSRHSGLRLVATAFGTLVVAYTCLYDAAYLGLFSSPEPRYAATNWLVHHAPTGSRIAFDFIPTGLTTLPVLVTREGYRPCFAQFETRQLRTPSVYLVLDAYNAQLHPQVAQSSVDRFLAALHRDATYRLVEDIHYVPTFLGLRFLIDSSPHDWRYPSHEIWIYRHTTAQTLDHPHCYDSLQAAINDLHKPSR